MRAGTLRDHITVERRGETGTDAWGSPSDGAFFEHIPQQPARIIPMGGDETIRADRLSGTVKFDVVLRWSVANAGIRADDRFVLARACASLEAGAILNVRHSGVDPTGKRRELRFICESGVAT